MRKKIGCISKDKRFSWRCDCCTYREDKALCLEFVKKEHRAFLWNEKDINRFNHGDKDLENLLRTELQEDVNNLNLWLSEGEK